MNCFESCLSGAGLDEVSRTPLEADCSRSPDRNSTFHNKLPYAHTYIGHGSLMSVINLILNAAARFYREEQSSQVQNGHILSTSRTISADTYAPDRLSSPAKHDKLCSASLATRLRSGHAKLEYSSLAREDRDFADQDPRMTRCVRHIVPNLGEIFDTSEKARRAVMICSYHLVLP